MKYYYKEDNINRIQSLVDFSKGGKFVFRKDFPFEFYTQIDTAKDVTFNIQFMKIEFEETEEIPEHKFEIKAYILDSQQIDYLKGRSDIEPNAFCFTGYYDIGHRIGKIVLEKEKISKYLSLNYNNYLYIVITKSNSNINTIYTNIQGQFSFYPQGKKVRIYSQ